jgi:hypothetical protein
MSPGLVALLRQIGPQLTPHAIEEPLKSTGRPIVDSRNGVTTPPLDLFAAVMKVRQNAKPRRGAALFSNDGAGVLRAGSHLQCFALRPFSPHERTRSILTLGNAS